MSLKHSPQIDELIQKEKKIFFQTYKRSELIPMRGEGYYLFDEFGNRYLDLSSGLGVNALGHAHPKIIEAVIDQVRQLSHLSNGFINPTQIDLAEKIYDGCKKARIFFTNSGTESVESALKLVRRWAKTNNKKSIFAFSKAFHGRTLGALSLTYKEKYREGFGPLMEEVSHLTFNSLDDLDKINEHTAAVFLEFVLGEGGVRPVSKEFAEKLDNLHKKYEFLLVADEIQAGLGRTGKFFAYQHVDINPDIVVCAKPLGGGLPLGACLADEKLADIWKIGEHGTTFGGNPIACAAGLVVLNWLLEGGGLSHIQEMEKVLTVYLKELKSQFPTKIKEVRVIGLMAAIELHESSAAYSNKGLDYGLILNATDETVIRLLPPLIIDKNGLTEMKEKLSKVLEN